MLCGCVGVCSTMTFECTKIQKFIVRKKAIYYVEILYAYQF